MTDWNRYDKMNARTQQTVGNGFWLLRITDAYGKIIEYAYNLKENMRLESSGVLQFFCQKDSG